MVQGLQSRGVAKLQGCTIISIVVGASGFAFQRLHPQPNTEFILFSCAVNLLASCFMLLSHSHSIVPGGLEVMSKTTRLTPATSLTMRRLVRASRSVGNLAHSAVIKSSVVTARRAMTSS
jgi:hypothetical protein